MDDHHFRFSASVVLLPFVCVLALWVIFWADVSFHLHLGELGVYPRTFSGLRGILLMPFIHGSAEHLYNNSIPLLILIAALRYFYREQSMRVMGYGILLSGLITWIIGRESYHIGASALIYVLVAYIFFTGIKTKYYRLVALSMMVVFIYGGTIWYIFPHVKEDISWEGHLAGLIAGFVFSAIFHVPEYKRIVRYDWERPDFDTSQDKFMQRFDADGNFVNLPTPDPELDKVVEPGVLINLLWSPKPLARMAAGSPQPGTANFAAG